MSTEPSESSKSSLALGIKLLFGILRFFDSSLVLRYILLGFFFLGGGAGWVGG